MHLVGYSNIHLDKLLRFQEYFIVHKKHLPPTSQSEKCLHDTITPPCIIPPVEDAVTLNAQLSNSQLGDLHVSKSEYAEAIHFYTQALADLAKSSKSNQNTQAIGALSSRASCYFRVQKYQKALTDLNCAISLDPMCRNAYDLRANVFLAMDNQQAAALDYMRMSEIDKTTTAKDKPTKAPTPAPTNPTTKTQVDYHKKPALNPHAVLNMVVVVFCFSVTLTCICIALFR